MGETLDSKLINLFGEYGYTVNLTVSKNKWIIDLVDVDKKQNITKIIKEHGGHKMQILTMENFELFCEDNFFDESVTDTMRHLVEGFETVEAEVEEVDDENGYLKLKLSIKSV